jgi:hypothetical protein
MIGAMAPLDLHPNGATLGRKRGLRPSSNLIEASPRQAAGNLHRKDDNFLDIRSLTPQQATGNALAYAVQVSRRSIGMSTRLAIPIRKPCWAGFQREASQPGSSPSIDFRLLVWFPSINGPFPQSRRQSAGSLVRRTPVRLRAIP